MNNTLALLRETAESWKRAGKDRDFVLGQLKQIAPQQQALVDQVIHQFFPNGHSTNSDLDTVARVEAAMGRFESIARAAIARGENRVLPIAIGGKNPAIPWVNVEPPQNDIDTMSSSEWAKRVESWVAEIAAEPTLRDLNCCVVAKDDEHLFIDSDSYREFIAGYEAYAKQPFPKTYTTSARENRAQIHFRQTDATRALGNIGQFQAGEIDLSVRQHNQYVLAEGSQHPKGSMYQRIVDASIAPMPDKLVEYIEHLKASAEKKASANSGVADGAPRNERGLIPHGHIHPWLVSEAGKLRANGCTPDEIEDILLRRAHEECQEPLDDNHIIQVARSMENYPPTSPSKPIRLSGQQTAPAAAPAVQPEPVAEPVEPAKSIKELIDENKEAYDAANKPAANDELPDVIVENGITYAIIPHGKGFKRVALDTSVACARPVFPYYVMNGTSIYENLVQPAVENSSKHAEFIFLPAVQVMLNYLSDKVSIPFQKTNLNMFLGLISPYGKFFKSTSCELAHEYMKAVGIFDTASSTMRKGGAEGKVMVDQAGSPEGFALEMQRVTGTLGHAHAILYNDELGKLVSKAAIENSSFSSDMLSWYGSALFANKIKNEKSRFSFAAGAYTFGWLWCTTDRNFNTYWPRLAGKSSGIQDRMFFVVSQ
jgi:hypothetical protein